jgi:hypothetical protein
MTPVKEAGLAFSSDAMRAASLQRSLLSRQAPPHAMLAGGHGVPTF